MPNSDLLSPARQILQTVFGLPDFRPNQLPIITAALSGQDVVAVLPTGGGKSLCFQVPALLKPGLTLVITPLISLMVDQATKLQSKKIATSAWHSQLSQTEEKELLTKLKNHTLKILYLSPEKLASPRCQQILKKLSIDLLVVDEAHCISLWGHDFRPAYLKIKQWLQSRSNRPQVIALTATATQAVQAEICRALNLIDPIVLTTSSVRTNVSLAVYPRQTPIKKYLTVLTLLANQPTETVMLYCATRGEVDFLARVLKQWRLAVPESKRDARLILAYHGGMDPTDRKKVQADFLEHTAVIMVATNAFGMGIDKPNIRLIIHIQLPSNLENYAQEIGRAGRDGREAKAVLLVSDVDWELQLEMAQRQPDHQRKMTWLRHFILTDHCRQKMLANYFGETTSNCHKCDVCSQPKETLRQVWPDKNVWDTYQKLKSLHIPYPDTLKFIALTRPQNFSELQQLPGIGWGWLRKWGTAVLKITTSKIDTIHHLQSHAPDNTHGFQSLKSPLVF